MNTANTPASSASTKLAACAAIRRQFLSLDAATQQRLTTAMEGLALVEKDLQAEAAAAGVAA